MQLSESLCYLIIFIILSFLNLNYWSLVIKSLIFAFLLVIFDGEQEFISFLITYSTVICFFFDFNFIFLNTLSNFYYGSIFIKNDFSDEIFFIKTYEFSLIFI